MKQNFVSRIKNMFHEMKILFTETKICFNTVNNILSLSLFSPIICKYKYTTSHHKVIKDDASRKAVRITVGFGSH